MDGRFVYRKTWLRMFGAHCTRLNQIKWAFEAENELNGVSRLRDVSDFELVNRRYGRRQMLFPGEAAAARSRQRRWRQPRAPLIQALLKQAYKLKEHLERNPGINRKTLASDAGISPTRLTMILNLLNLAPVIQQYILRMPPSTKKGPITERRLRKLAMTTDHQTQIAGFENMLPQHALIFCDKYNQIK